MAEQNLKIEHIGAAKLSLGKRIRRSLSDLFGSRYAELLRTELIQLRLEKSREIDRLIAERDAVQARLDAALKMPTRYWTGTAQNMPAGMIPAEPERKTWQQVQAEAIAENARLEAEESKKSVPPKEN